MPPACRTPGFLGETMRRDEHDDVLEEDEEEVDVDALGMQLTISTVKPQYQPSTASSKGTSTTLNNRALEEGNGVVVEGDDSVAVGEMPKVLQVLAAVLDRLVARNEQFANSPSQQGKKLTIFHGLRAPSISIAKYLERIFKYTSCSPSCFVVGYVFLDRLIHRQPDLLVTSLNVHRLLVTSVMVATKMLDDVHFNNAFFARVGGVSVLELNRLELEFLFRLDFKLSVSISMFQSYCTYLERDISAVVEKRPERVERSLPAFGTSPVSQYSSTSGTPRGSSPPTPQENSPKIMKRVSVPPGLPVSYISRKQQQQSSLQYQQPLSQYFVRNSPPSR